MDPASLQWIAASEKPILIRTWSDYDKGDTKSSTSQRTHSHCSGRNTKSGVLPQSHDAHCHNSSYELLSHLRFHSQGRQIEIPQDHKSPPPTRRLTQAQAVSSSWKPGLLKVCCPGIRAKIKELECKTDIKHWSSILWEWPVPCLLPYFLCP